MGRPFLKWAGGKTQLLDEILSRKPESFSRYVEPMLGGGAVYFALATQDPTRPALLNDINPELENAYSQVKTHPEEVITFLQQWPQDAEAFYRIRLVEKSDEYASWSDAMKAARTIFLNKLGYNGLYRVNASGFFNVPFGKRSGINFDYDNIREASRLLTNADVCNGSYTDLQGRIQPDDWIYLDPPYLPLSETSNFTQYNASGFDISDHRRLKDFFDECTRIGAKVLMSNSHAPAIIQMYSEYNISIVFARRSINSKGSRRGSIPEVLISNY